MIIITKRLVLVGFKTAPCRLHVIPGVRIFYKKRYGRMLLRVRCWKIETSLEVAIAPPKHTIIEYSKRTTAIYKNKYPVQYDDSFLPR